MISGKSNGNGRARLKGQDLGKLMERLPPHRLEAEAALLGSMILDWRVCGEVLQIIHGPEDFYKPAHAAIYQALIDLYDKNQSIDVVQLVDLLERRGQLQSVGGTDYLITLAESVPNALSAHHYAKIVRGEALRRRLIEASAETLRDCFESSRDADELIDEAEARVFRVAQQREQAQEAVQAGVLLQQLYDDLAERDGRLVVGLPTGFFELDELTSGLHPGEMVILAARPSIGKTALALGIAEHVAMTQKKPVAIFSLEMDRKQLGWRLACARSGIDLQLIRRNTLNQEGFARLAEAVGAVAESPLYIDDTPGLTLLSLRAKARRLAMDHDIKLVVIDYLQLMEGPKSESRQQEVSALSRGIKAMARELDVPVLCLSQLNRSPDSREDHRPRLSDLRESGAIEQDADVVLLLHREDYYHRGEADYQPTNTAEVIVAKQRQGPPGTVRLQFDGPTMRFNNLRYAPQAAGRGYR